MERENTKNWGMLILLMACYSLAFVDRYIINLLVSPIKRDLHFTDTEVSLLLGASFAVFYSIMGLPFGIWADSKNRAKLVGIGIAIWSVATSSLAFLKTFPLMFMGRVGVGIGEASLTPSAYSLISDRFSKEKATTALSIYSLGIYIGIAIAYIGGGALIGYLEKQPMASIAGFNIYLWQLTFLIVGLPGLLLALVVRTFIKDKRQTTNEKHFPLFSNLKTLNRKTKLMLAAFGVLSIAVYGSGVWIPEFLQRSFQLPVATVGQITGVGLVVLPAIGLFLGSFINRLVSRRQGNNKTLFACFIISLLFLPFSGTYGLFTELTPALVFLGFYGLTVSAIVGVGAACIQEMAAEGQKGFLTSVYILVQNMIGYGLGPTLIGVLTDYLFKDTNHLGSSIFIVCIVSCAIASTLFYLSIKAKKREQR